MSGGNANAGNATAAGAAPVGSPTTWVDALGALAPRGSIPEGGLGALRVASVPAGGESFLLMHARWKKLQQDIYHPRKGRFDISKVPDVYDAAKYDAIHNSHLSLDGLEELYRVSRRLAEGVVPNEYGTHPQSKLRIGGTIAHSLLLKLLQDMFTTREETFVGMPQSHVAPQQGGSALSRESRDGCFSSDGGGRATGGSESDTSQAGGGGDRGGGARRGAQKAHHAAAASDPLGAGEDARDPRGLPEVDEEDAAALKEEEEEELSTTRLNHRIANTVGVHSPHRHVRTRLYFTSESHIHSLLNVLRYCNLEVAQFGRIGEGSGTPAGPRAEEACRDSHRGRPRPPRPRPPRPPRRRDRGRPRPGRGPTSPTRRRLCSRARWRRWRTSATSITSRTSCSACTSASISPRRTRDDSASRFCSAPASASTRSSATSSRSSRKPPPTRTAARRRASRQARSPGRGASPRTPRRCRSCGSFPCRTTARKPRGGPQTKKPRRRLRRRRRRRERRRGRTTRRRRGEERGVSHPGRSRDVPLEVPAKQERGPRRRRGGGGHGSSASDGAWSPKKEALPGRISFSKEERKKSYLGGPKRSKERKKKGSDSESE